MTFVYRLRFVPRRQSRGWDNVNVLEMRVSVNNKEISHYEATRLGRQRLREFVREPRRWKLKDCHLR